MSAGRLRNAHAGPYPGWNHRVIAASDDFAWNKNSTYFKNIDHVLIIASKPGRFRGARCPDLGPSNCFVKCRTVQPLIVNDQPYDGASDLASYIQWPWSTSLGINRIIYRLRLSIDLESKSSPCISHFLPYSPFSFPLFHSAVLSAIPSHLTPSVYKMWCGV